MVCMNIYLWHSSFGSALCRRSLEIPNLAQNINIISILYQYQLRNIRVTQHRMLSDDALYPSNFIRYQAHVAYHNHSDAAREVMHSVLTISSEKSLNTARKFSLSSVALE